VLRHPVGDQNRLWTCTILLGAACPPVHVTITVTRYGVVAVQPAVVTVGQLFVS
jgi:hypothetical protein